MKTKIFTKKRIVLGIVAVVLIGVLIAANILINQFSYIMHSYFSGGESGFNSGNTAATDALENSDLTVRQAAEDSMVLLKNDDFLPLKDLKKVNLFGYGSTDAGLLLTGGGSGGTSITDEKAVKVDLTDAFTAAGIEYNKNVIKAYENYSTFDADYRSGGSTGANATESLINPPASFYTASLMDEAYNFSDVAVVTLSRWGAENGGTSELVNIGSYKNGTFLELTTEETAMFNALQAKNFKVIVLLNTCNDLELGFIEKYSSIKACIYMGIPGQSGAAAVPKIINGTVNPSGRISDTLPYDHQTFNPVYANATQNNSNITYQEGIYFGYKWYETADAEGYFDAVNNEYGTGYNGVVQFPFGYGLSYTTFSWEKVSTPTALADGENVVKIKVKNTGSVAGKDVVQLYGHAPYTAGGIEKAERVLLDFAKTPTLYPESEKDADHPNECVVELKFTAYDLASYDAYDKNANGFTGYELEKGAYTVSAMKNSHDKSGMISCTLNVAESKTFDKDPTTGNTVENRFTGATAYANCPIDAGVTYLSRNGGFANFPTAHVNGGAANASQASKYVYDGYNGTDVSTYESGVDFGLYLVQSVNGEGATATYSRPTKEMLSGEDGTAKLAFNTDIIELLLDYDSEIWDIIISQMTKDELKALIGRGGFKTQEIYSIGKPRATDKDGPAGFNNNVSSPGKSSVYTLLPDEALIGCSFDKDVAYALGVAQAKEAGEFGINGWYAPGVNLHRSVYNSRNYEYFSEDAVLSGKLAANVVKGAKDNNLYCYVKHFAVSEEGQNPNEVNTWLTEQALRENYLKPFEIAVKEGGAVAVMSAFNNVGAVLSGYNHALLTDILRNEWGFKGSVITDWFMGSGYMSNFKAGVIAGNDLWLGGTSDQAATLDLDNPAEYYAARRSAKNILYTYVSTNAAKTDIKVNAAPHSATVDIIWIGVNVLLGLGIAACVLFMFLPVKKKQTETQE